MACSWLSESLRLESLQPIRAAELLQTVTRESTQDDDGGGKKRNTNAADKSTSTITATAVEKPVVPTEAGKNKSGMVPSAKGSIAAPHEGDTVDGARSTVADKPVMHAHFSVWLDVRLPAYPAHALWAY